MDAAPASGPRVAIIGAGIAGLTAAFWLRRTGARPVVFEARPSFQPAGFPINLFGHALTVLDRMGLGDRLTAAAMPVDRLTMMTPAGRVIRSDDISGFSRMEGHGLYLDRVDLHHALYDAVRDDTAIRFGQEVADIQRQGSEIVLADGTVRPADLTLAADGLHSATRDWLFGAAPLHAADAAFTVALMPGTLVPAGESFSLIGPGRTMAVTGLPDGRTSAIFWVRQTVAEAAGADTPIERLRRMYEDFGWKTAEVIDAAAQTEHLYTDRVLQVRLPQWHRGRTVLIGDAAYAASPISSRGAGLAIVGAYLFAQALAETGDARTAALRFERRLRAGVERIQETALKNVPMMIPETAGQAGMQRAFLRLMPAAMMQRAMAQQFTQQEVDSLDTTGAPARVRGPAGEPVLTVSGVCKRYGTADALKGLSFEVRRGEIFGLLGPNGAGKTTALEIIEGLRAPDAGTVAIGAAGHPAGSAAAKELLGVQLQASAIYDRIRLDEAMRLFAGYYRTHADIDALLTQAGLGLRRDATFGTLSFGQQKRFSLALALVNAPEIVVLDEPTAGLDPDARRSICDQIAEMRAEGRAVLMSTHHMSEADALCDRVLILDKGRTIETGRPADLIAGAGLGARLALTPGDILARSDVAGLAHVTGCHHENGQLIVDTDAPERTLARLAALASERQVSLNEITIRQASLEDLFFERTGRRLDA
ncbi:ATP-binding cassette domain-containing protein [Psychromarinibacter sp. C21-152]|uniref:ATP-binding cassette domain-containing protein n=1 Tax=Psychromarinibacter sediminicola TaxID=3033385 RepID=A0AAE3NX49_9RHOB|nr:ATP-binding cassette domain-containing protein [Psychromarinibacter sediminicola]MDF0602565.1 ATP-binding cassette domain-containing protein [Psychromarinibacter sediminicola]